VVKDVVEYDDFTGRFEAAESVEIRARVSGYLDRIAFQDGAVVKKGDPLFIIDRRPYKAALDQAQASVVSAQARLNFAQADLERAQSLQKTGNIAEQSVDQRRQAFITAGRSRTMPRRRSATRSSTTTSPTCRAPISGRIGRKLVTEGNLVSANETLLTTIVSLDPIYFYFDVDERSFLAYSRTQAEAKAKGGTYRERGADRPDGRARAAAAGEDRLRRQSPRPGKRHDPAAGCAGEQGSVSAARSLRNNRGDRLAASPRHPRSG
jgi:RND family efflux transporter MFP subunit